MGGKKGETQVGFHSSRARYRMLATGNRWGKTTTAAQELIWRANKRHPYNAESQIKGPVRLRACADGWSRGVEGVMVPLFRDRTDPLDLRGGSFTDAYQNKDHTLHFKDGSYIEFISYEIADTGRGAQKFASVPLDGFWHDEQSPYMVWEENCARIIDRNGFGIITLTPVLGSTWEFDEVYQKWQNGNKSYECWVGSTDENEILDPTVIEEIFGDLSDPVMRDIRRHGTWTTIAGAVYPEFNRERHVVPFAPERVSEAVRRFFVLDPAPSKPSAVGAFGIGAKGDRFQFGEIRVQGTIPERATQIRSHFKDYTFDRYLCDPNWDYEDKELGLNRYELWQDEGFPLEKASDDKEYGIEIVRKNLSLDPISQEPYFQVMDNCARTIWEFQHYRWKPKTASDDLTYKPKTRDVDDDLVSCVRYFMVAAQAWGGMKPQKATRSKVRRPSLYLSRSPR